MSFYISLFLNILASVLVSCLVILTMLMLIQMVIWILELVFSLYEKITTKPDPLSYVDLRWVMKKCNLRKEIDVNIFEEDEWIRILSLGLVSSDNMLLGSKVKGEIYK